MRSVQVVDQSSGNTTRADHVIGIDESGNVTGPDAFAIAAVRCPRVNGETLAEILLQHDLNPWQAKSQTITESISAQERDQRVEQLIDSLNAESIPWSVAVGYSGGSIHHKAASVTVLAKKTITSAQDFSGDAVLIPDGAPSMYGDHQTHLRTQASQIFDGSFQSTFGGVYITGLQKADLTYPEATAADYIAAYVRRAVHERDLSVQDLPEQVIWYDSNWREPSVSPVPFYQIQGVSGNYGDITKTRAAAWIKGRHPDGNEFDASSQWDNTVDMLESTELQNYLLNDIVP
jgi:hypothetical protein